MREELCKKMQVPERYDNISKSPITDNKENKVWKGFLEMIQNTMKKDMKNCVHTIHEGTRHRIFTGYYFYYVNFKNLKDIERLRKIVMNYAEVISLEEHYEFMLQLYNQRIREDPLYF